MSWGTVGVHVIQTISRHGAKYNEMYTPFSTCTWVYKYKYKYVLYAQAEMGMIRGGLVLIPVC